MLTEKSILLSQQGVRNAIADYQALLGKRVLVERVLSKQSIDVLFKHVTGKVVDMTPSLVVIERDDLSSGSNSHYPQMITFTFSDFITNLYTIEEIL